MSDVALITQSPVLATAAAPGKVILLGEHAVVYGYPALAVPVTSVGARAVVARWDGPLTVRAHYPASEARPPRVCELATAPEEDALATAVRGALRQAGMTTLPAWLIEVTSTIPYSRGMGSSAALAVVLARATALAAGARLDDATVAELALDAERRTHGTPSGIDNSVIAWCQPIRFRHGGVTWIAIGTPLTLVIADSGSPGATREMVAAVRDRCAEQPAACARWFRQIGRVVDEATTAVASGNHPELGRLMNRNHRILRALGVCTPELDALVAAARCAGALGAKLSGAGGGGIIVALVTSETAPAVTSALLEAGAARIIQATVAAQEPG